MVEGHLAGSPCCPFFFFFNNFIYLFIFPSLGLSCCEGLFSSCEEQGLLSSRHVQASHCGGFSCCGAWARGAWTSIPAVHGVSSCSSRALEHRLNRRKKIPELEIRKTKGELNRVLFTKTAQMRVQRKPMLHLDLIVHHRHPRIQILVMKTDSQTALKL